MTPKIFIDKRVLVNGKESHINMHNFLNLNQHIINVIGNNTIADVVVSNTLFVTENGDDSTGTRERLDLPYATILTAMDNAQSGDVVVVYAGTYTESGSNTSRHLVKEDVCLFCHPNVKVTITNPHSTLLQPSYYINEITNGIFGHGEFTFSRVGGPKTTMILNNETDTIDEKSFIFECKYLGFNGTEMSVGSNLVVFRLQCDIIESISNSRAIFVDDMGVINSAKGTYVFNINRFIGYFESGTCIMIKSCFSSSIDIKIKDFVIDNFQTFAPIIVQNNSQFSNIKIHIDSFRQTENIFSEMPIILNSSCSGTKDIRISGIITRSILFEPMAFNVSFPEQGKYEFNGMVLLNQPLHNPSEDSYSLIDFRTRKQNTIFDLNLFVRIDDAYPPGYPYDPIVLNISKEINNAHVDYQSWNQKVTGRIHVIGVDTVTSNAAVQYGLMQNGSTTAGSTAILDKFVIVTTANQPSIGTNDAASIAAIPIMNSYSNRAIAGGLNTPNQIIETITINVHVK